MKQKIQILFLLLLGCGTMNAQTQFWSDNFEDVGSPSAGSRAISIAEFACTSPVGYFQRSTGTETNAGFTLFSGSKFFAAMNVDLGSTCVNNSISAGQTITWSGINIAGKANLSFKGLFGANSIGTAASFQGTPFAASGTQDSLVIQYRINGGAWTKLIGLYSDLSQVNAGPLRVDSDGDFVGDGTTMVSPLTELTANITGTGTTLDLRFAIFDNNGIPGSMAIDNFRLFEGSALNVTLSSFEAIKENGTTGLYWATATEKDNAGFDIQRSADGKAYQTIGSVASKAKDGNSIQTISYSFYDKAPLSGMNFYRLAEKDKQGRIVYSDVRTLNFDGKSDFNCYPNPVKGQLNIEYNSDKEAQMNVKVTDVLGKVVIAKAMNFQKGFNKATIDMASLSYGIYNITIVSNSGVVYTSRITKK